MTPRRRPRLALVQPVTRWWDRRRWWTRAVVAAGLLLLCVLYPLTLTPFWRAVLFPVGISVLLALGLNVVVGQAGLLDLGYVAFYAVGAYTLAKLSTALGWTAWEALPVAVVAAVVAGVVLGAPTLRLRGDYLAIVTLGFGEIVRLVAQNSEWLGQARGITGIPHPTAVLGTGFGFDPLPYYYLTLAAIVLAVVMVVRLNRSRVGRAWVAIREDEDAAEAMGVPTFRMKLWAFAIGASTGGVAGWIYGSKVSYINPDNFPFFISMLVLAGVILGGMGSVPGAILGGFLIGFLPEYLQRVAAGETLRRWLNALFGGHADSILEYRVLLFGALLVLIMIFRPQGLLPSRRRSAELADAGEGKGLAVAAEVTGDAGGVAPETAGVGSRGDGQAGTQGEPDRTAPLELAREAEEADGQPVLQLNGVGMEFGGVVALSDLDLSVRRGEILAVIGPNGAGKTTVFNCVTGVFRPVRGDIRLDGRRLVGRRRWQVTRSGVARTFQNIRLFPNMTALENVLVGLDARHGTSVPGALLGLPRHRREEREGRREARRLLDLVGIAHRADDLARNLPYGDQRRLEIARAVATRPRVLLLDEPAAGMNQEEKRRLVQLVRDLRAAGLTIVLIEHDMSVVMDLSDRVVVLDFGQRIAEGAPAEVQSDPRVIEAYLGVPADAP